MGGIGDSFQRPTSEPVSLGGNTSEKESSSLQSDHDIERSELLSSSSFPRKRLKSLGAENSERAEALFRKATKYRLVKVQEPLLLIEFWHDGNYQFMELKREEILQEAINAIPEADKALVKENRFGPNKRQTLDEAASAHSSDSRFSRSGFRQTGTIKARDIRLLDSNFSNSHDPSIVVRKHAVLVNLEPIKSLVLHNRCLVLVPNGADSELQTFMEKLRLGPESRSMDGIMEFELRAFEAIFLTVSGILNKELKSLKPEIELTLKNVLKTGSFSLERLRLVKKDLDHLLSRMQGVQHAFTELLDNDRDMALMNLTKLYETPNKYSEQNNEAWFDDHEEIELLLEAYLQAVDGTFSQAKLLNKEIDSAMDLLMLRLDTARNSLLRIDLMVSSITSVAAVGALVAGIFGMNLSSGVEDTPHWFWGVASTLVFGSIILVTSIFWYIRHKGWLIA